MKLNTLLLAIAFIFGAMQMGYAQLPDGSIAPDFTITDLEGEEHNLYSLVGEQIINDNLGTLAAGEYNHVLNFNGVTAGVYLIHLTAGGETTTMRATLK